MDIFGKVTYQYIDNSIQHSWLKLPDDAWVDPFPAGAYALSPLLFPPFGLYHETFPASVYIPADNIPAYANAEMNWKRAENIAHVFSYFPYKTPKEVISIKTSVLQQKLSEIAKEVAVYIGSRKSPIQIL